MEPQQPRVQINGNQRRRLNDHEYEVFATVNDTQWQHVTDPVNLMPLDQPLPFERARLLWQKDAALSDRQELDYFLLCFPTQLIPQICFLTSNTLKRRNINIEVSQAELLKYLGILLMMALDGKDIKNRDVFWMKEGNDMQHHHNNHHDSADYRFGMTLQRFSDISEALRFPGTAENATQQDPMAYIRVLIEAINQKRKAVVQVGEFLRVEDSVILRVIDQVKLKIQWIGSNMKQDKTAFEGDLFGSLNCLSDADSGVAIAYDYVDIDEDLKRKFIKEFDTVTSNQFTSSMLRMSKSFFHSNRTILTSNVFTSIESATVLVDYGLHMIGQMTSLKQRVPIHHMIRYHGQSAITERLVIRATILGKLNAMESDVYAISFKRNEVPVEVEDYPSEFNSLATEEIEHYLFNRGSTSNGNAKDTYSTVYSTAPKSNQRPALVEDYERGEQVTGKELYAKCEVVPKVIVNAKNWWHGPFQAILIRLCVDAYYAQQYEYHSAGVAFNTGDDHFASFVTKLARQLIGPKPFIHQNANNVVNPSYPVEASSSSSNTAAIPVSSSSSNGMINNIAGANPSGASALAAAVSLVGFADNEGATNIDPDLHKFHRLLPLSKLPYYTSFREQNKRAKRRCRMCHNPTGYYCIQCSDFERQIYFSMCHPTSKPDSTCYYTHLTSSTNTPAAAPPK